MGILDNGQWHEQALALTADDGRFHRPESRFRNWISRDGAPGPTGTGGFPAESGRYHAEIATLLRELGIEVVVAVGEPARAFLDGAASGVAVADAAAFGEALDVLRPGDAILVKASRAVGLEGIPALIEKHTQAWHES